MPSLAPSPDHTRPEALVRPDHAHRAVCSDPAIFALEIPCCPDMQGRSANALFVDQGAADNFAIADILGNAHAVGAIGRDGQNLSHRRRR